MKLFKAAVHWHYRGTQRIVTLHVVGSEAFMRVTADYVKKTHETTFNPPVQDPHNPMPEIEFLAGLWCTAQRPLMAWLATPPGDAHLASLAGLGEVVESVCRNIEHTPRSAEHLLELHFRSDVAQVPPQLGLLLFNDEIMQQLVEKESEFETQLAEKSKDKSLEELGAILRAELPPLTYTCIEPPIPDEAKQALERMRQAHKLATTPPAGSA
jgi:hypothetical protein